MCIIEWYFFAYTQTFFINAWFLGKEEHEEKAEMQNPRYNLLQESK
jgi:uncharacterized membrane protein YfhO